MFLLNMFPTKTEYKRQEVFETQHKTVCVLGGSGLIGTAVCDLLDTSNEIKKGNLITSICWKTPTSKGYLDF